MYISLATVAAAHQLKKLLWSLMDVSAVMTAAAPGRTEHQLHLIKCIVQHEQHVMCA